MTDRRIIPMPTNIGGAGELWRYVEQIMYYSVCDDCQNKSQTKREKIINNSSNPCFLCGWIPLQDKPVNLPAMINRRLNQSNVEAQVSLIVMRGGHSSSEPDVWGHFLSEFSPA